MCWKIEAHSIQWKKIFLVEKLLLGDPGDSSVGVSANTEIPLVNPTGPK